MKALVSLIAVAVASSAYCQMVEVPKEINDYKWMVGTWTTEGNFTMMGQSVPYTAEYVVTMEGPFIKATTTMKMMGMEMKDTAYLHFDGEKKEYVMTTYASWATTPRVDRGTVVNGALILTSAPWDVMGTKTVGRSTLKNLSANEFSYKLEMQDADGKWETASDSVFKRKS